MNKKKIIATVVMIVALIMIFVITLNKEEEQPVSGFEAHKIVAHAMGESTAMRIPMLGRHLSLTMNGALAYLKLIFAIEG